MSTKNLTVMWAVAILIACAAGAASAQMGMRNAPPAFSGKWHPVVGSGAIYEVQSTGAAKRTLEFDIVGKESAEGKDAVWLEMTMNSPDMTKGAMIIKELVAFDA